MTSSGAAPGSPPPTAAPAFLAAPPSGALDRRLRGLAALLEQARDVLSGRVVEPEPPAWSERRGWTGFLRGLDEPTLAACEERGPAALFVQLPGAPSDLRALAAEARRLTSVERLEPGAEVAPLRRATARKREQVAALAALARRWAAGGDGAGAGARRVVEYGAGHGHLTRAVAEAIGRPAVGLERRLALVDTARALTADERVRFEARDARADPVSLGPDDLLLGLHACGALGDSLVQAAAQRGCAVMLVSCCPQKVPGPSREPISALGRSVGLSLERPLLGLANLATPLEGGADAADVMARRHRRRALYLLLREAGVELSPGDETRGLSRRRFRHPLEALIPFAFARRGLAAPSARAVGRAAERARMEHDLIRRYALPRTMLARALEVAIAADRAQALAEAGPGSPVRLVEAFARSSSPRNLLIQRGPVG